MRDPRLDKWAEVLVDYSLQAKKGEYAILVGEPEGAPLLEACYQKLIQVGAHVEPFIIPSEWSEILYKYGSDKQLSWTGPAMKQAADQCDLFLKVGSELNTTLLANYDPQKNALASIAREPLAQSVMNRYAKNEMRWTYTHYPTASAAQMAQMGTHEYEEFILSLCHLNEPDPISHWKQVEKEQQRLIELIEDKKILHFRNDQGTDLQVNIDGMKWVNCCGKINFPDGEIYTGPNLKVPDGGVNGVARLSFPTIYRYNEVHEIELFFKDGAVYEANASKGQEFLREMIGQDAGAKYVGEIAIGTNKNMNRITKNILFDEKFYGTFHLALGRGYPQTKNSNESALHWDITFDLRKGGTIYADDLLISKDGEFVV